MKKFLKILSVLYKAILKGRTVNVGGVPVTFPSQGPVARSIVSEGQYVDGRKRLLGGALSALALLAAFLTNLAPIAQSTFGPDAKAAVYILATGGFLTWSVGVLHGAWKLYFHEEHA